MYVSPTGSMARRVWPICSSYSSASPNVFFSRSMDWASDCTAMATCSTRLIFMARILSCVARRQSWVAREELDQQAIDLGRVLVRRPVAGRGNPVQVEVAHRPANLADQERGGATDRAVCPPPQ